jgi:membrane-bound serine protease (ClpP class)
MHTRWKMLLLILITAWVTTVWPDAAQGRAPRSQEPAGGPVVVMQMKGALHPAMLEHLKRTQSAAVNEGAQLILLELDTPGGEVQLLNQIIEAMRGSDTPIVVYVTPRGAMAGSAGAVVTIAGHRAAMAPETTIGAASPVGGSGEDIGEAMESKLKGMLRATVRSLTTNRPPEAVEAAEDMIETARALSSDEALEIGLIDYIARDRADLLRQLDGQTLVFEDETLLLQTSGVQTIEVPRTFMEEVLMVLANPNIAFLLLAIGVQAILIEISSPGGWVAGFIGVVCLLLATYGMGLLPVNWFGLLFMVVAFVLFILEIKTPTYGALTAAGVGAFIVGALVLFNSPNVPAFQRVSVPLVVGTGASIGLLFFVIVGFALRAQRAPLRVFTTVVGQRGTVASPLGPVGTVQIGSELWSAIHENERQHLPRGTRVEVVGQENLRLLVRALRDEDPR